MRSSTAWIGLLLLALSPLAWADSKGAEAEIRALLHAQEVAWNQGDADGYSAHFAEDGTFTNIRGTRFSGREAFVARHREVFSTFFKGSTLQSRIERLHAPTPDVVVVDLLHEVSNLSAFPPGVAAAPDGVLRTRLLQVFVHREGAWALVAYHNVDIKPEGASPASKPR